LKVIASILQNFDLTLDDPKYKLEIVESLTIKPGNLYIRAKLRNGRTPTELCQRFGSTEPIPASLQTKNGISAPVGASQVINGTPMTILYGSNSGTCEALAHRLSRDAPSYGYSATTVATLDSAIKKLPKTQNELVVVVTSSYDGLPADNAVKFCDWLKTLQSNALSGMPFAVFACGMILRSYDQWGDIMLTIHSRPP
jgi:cytochrome P450/NADPH-cytochrome P450 reductase